MALRTRDRPDPAAGAPFAVELAVGSTVGDLVGRLGLADRDAKLIFVNHVRGRPDDPLSDGARIQIFPLIAGG